MRSTDAVSDGFIYNKAEKLLKSARNEPEFREAAAVFESIPGYADADDRKAECLERAEICRSESTYSFAMSLSKSEHIPDVELALKYFSMIENWNDTKDQIERSNRELKRLKELERKRKQAAAKRRAKLFTVLGLIILAALGVTGYLHLREYHFIPQSRYEEAEALAASGDYKAAYKIFDELGDYRDSADKARLYQWSSCEAGDSLYFGHYEQDNDLTNGSEEIGWTVLASAPDKVLVISDYCLDSQVYHRYTSQTTWENCTIRKWLNNDFLEEAFSEEERELILLTHLTTPESALNGTEGGNDTDDRIFFLSVDEVREYLTDPSAQSTPYAVARGAYVNSTNDCSWWWLRSPGNSNHYVSYVFTFGGINERGDWMNRARSGVRPAMWLRTKDIDPLSPES